MEIRNDKILKFSGRSPNDIYDFDNIYSRDGIGIQLINSNTNISFIDTSNNSKLNISLRNSNINLINSNGNLNFNNLSITNYGFVGINSTIPRSSLDVSGRINCLDINLSNSIITSNLINKLGTSINDINTGVLSSNCGGTNKSSFQNGQIIFGNSQSQFLNWNDDLKRVGIGMTNPQHSLDINGNLNGLFFRTYGKFISDGFSTKDDVSRSSNSSYFASSNNSYKNAYNYITIFKSELTDKIIDYEIWKRYSYGRNYTNLKVGIGNANPTSSLSITGDLNYTGNLRRFGSNIRTFNGDFNDLYNSVGVCWNLSNENIYKANTGSVGIGTTTIPLTILDINGGINFRSNIKKNGNIMKFFDGNYNNLNNLPNFSLFAYSGSFYHLRETPDFFNGDYYSLTDIPATFNVDWKKTISNLPKFFKTDWNYTIDNIPSTFDVDWNSNIFRKPFNFPTNWDTTIANKPQFFIADWCNSISNRPLLFDTDWKSNILNKPNFSKLAYTGQYDDVLNKPYIFSGDYKDLLEKPKYAEVCFTGNYYDLCNQPRLFKGNYNELSNIPTYFKTDWNSTILNLPDFKKIAISGSYKDLLDAPIDNWGENGTHIYSCNSINIGIGKTNPLYNLDITSNFFIDSSFKIIFNDIIVNNPPWAYYLPENWDNSSILRDGSGNNNHAITSGTITKLSASGNGATSTITYLSGNTSSYISFPSGSLSSNYTILSLTRYTGGSRGRILQSQSGNWLHGHWSGNRGVCHYDGWKTNYTNIGNVDDWLCCIGKNSTSTPNNILIDGVPSGTASGGGSNYQLGINLGVNEKSDWGFGCLFIWDKHLSDNDMTKLSDIIKNYLIYNGSLNNYIKNIFVYNECYLSNSLNINNQNFSNAFGVISEYNRTANWLNSGINAYNRNSGNIGIGTIQPSASYKLDVRGAINTNSNFNLSSSGSIFWSSYGTTGIGCAGVDGQYSTSSLTGDLVIRSQEGKKLILQNGGNISFFFINSGNIGIGTSSPSSLLHIHNSNSNMEMKILLTDGSTRTSSTNGFSLFKDSNGVANIWNYTNNNLRFGTSNIERMFIKNNGFIGIGTTNPSSLIHLHNSNSNSEVKLLLTDGSTGTTSNNGFSIYKSGDDDGYIWNYSNASLRFGTSNIDRIFIKNDGFIGIGITIPSSLIHLHNSNSNGEVKLLLTDGSTGTASNNGFSIYKDINEDGFIWNYSNVAIRIGTNNQENLTISNSGNIGIGTTNPSSLIHLHNSNSNSEVKLLLTDGSTGTSSNNGLSIYKLSNQDAYIWNYTNNSLNFGIYQSIPSYTMTDFFSPWAFYSAENFSGSNLSDTSGNSRNASTTGTITKSSASGNGSVNSITFISGDTSSTISFPTGSLPNSSYTILSLTRYTGDSRGRILQSQTGNWLHGHYNGNRGVCHYDGWKTNNVNIGNVDDWLCCIGKNSTSTPNNILIDGVPSGTASGGGSNYQLGINLGVNEKSDWALAYLIIWNKHLTDEEMFKMNNYFNIVKGYQNLIITTSGNIGIGINKPSSILHLHNSNFNGEVKLLFTDGSTGTASNNGFSIYKDINEDGFIWNYSNVAIRIGTNNQENLTISNSGNIGIGTTNPSSLIHLHNSNSNSEVKLLLTDGSTGTSSNNGFSLYKDINEDGFVWNYTNNSLKFSIYQPIPSYTMTDFFNPWGFYSAVNFSGSNLNDTSGNNRHATTTGTITKSIGSMNFISGGIESCITFPVGSIPTNFTILSLTRYNGGNKRKILTAKKSSSTDDTEWYHGHNSGTKGVCYYGSSISTGTSGNVDEWVCVIGKNEGSIPNNILINGISSGINTGGTGNKQLGINFPNNDWTFTAGYEYFPYWWWPDYLLTVPDRRDVYETRSDWALSHVIIWDKHLTTDEMITMNNYINTFLVNENLTISASGNIGLGINTPSSLLHLHNPSGEVKLLFTDGSTGSNATSGFSIYKSGGDDGYIWNYSNASMRFGTSNSERMSILNNGNIGIGTTSGLSYQLNINGTLNGYYLRGDGNLITNLSFSKISTGFLPVGLTGTGKNTLEINQILFGNGSSPLGQSANLYWDNANTLLGINKTNPSTSLDVLGTITATSFTGSGLSIGNLNTANFSSGSLPVGSGGTGKSIYTAGQILFGNSNSNIDSSINLFWDNTNSRLGINKTNPASNLDVSGTITGTFNGNGSAITSLNATNFSLGTLGTERGGTGTSTLTSGQILIANDTSAIYTSVNLFWDNSNSRLGIGKTNPSTALDVSGTITATNFSGNGSGITGLNAANITVGVLGIDRGGIGTSNLSNGRILFGNTTSALNSSKNLFWNNDNVGLGIGTTIPKYSLEAIGDINFTGDLKRNGISYTGDQGVWTSSGSNIYFNSGNVEIGSEIPDNPNKLNVVGTIKCSSYILQSNHIEISGSKVDLNYTNSFRSSQLKFNNNSFIRYAYGGLTTESGTFYLNTEVLHFLVSSSSTKSIQGFWFDNGSIGIGTRPETSRFRLRVSNGHSIDYVISSNITYISELTWFSTDPPTLINSSSGLTIPRLSTIFQGNMICTGSFNLITFSDIRIKNYINDINSSYAMDLINKIKPKSFKYIDYIENGYNDNYGFIAQEIKELLPEAITYNKEYIPNVFKLFDIIKDIIKTDEDLTSLLNIDDEIQIIDNKNKIDCKILEITSSYIKIDKSLEDDKIFVYGKKVDDFHVLNKEYIFTLNVCATQELHKKLEIQEKRIQELDKLLEEEDRKLREQEEKIELLLNNFF